MRLLLLTFYTILFSCSPKQKINKQSYKIDSELQNDKNLSFGSQNPETFDSEILETFVDSLNIGVKGKCKIELIRHRIYNDMFVIVKFYTKGRIPAKDSDVWMNTNLYVYQINTFGELFPSISDFNNDNFNDITFISGEAFALVRVFTNQPFVIFRVFTNQPFVIFLCRGCSPLLHYFPTSGEK